MTLEDKAYFVRRAETQLKLAQGSHNARAVNAHYTLAENYLEGLMEREKVHSVPTILKGVPRLKRRR